MLSWSAPSYTGGSPILGYNVYRNASGSWSLIASIVPSPHIDSGLQNGQEYGYIVRAVNGLGEGIPSEEVRVKPARIPDAPMVVATGGLRSVNLTWTAPLFDGGSDITGYAIYRGVSPGKEAFLVSVGNILTFQDSGLSDGTTYYYRVTALNEEGEGSPSAEVSASTLGLPGSPLGLTASPSGDYLHLSWLPPATDGGAAINGYMIYRGTSLDRMVAIALVNGTSYNDPDPQNGLTYHYLVAAVNRVGEGPTAGTSALMVRAPSELEGLTATPSSHRILLTWEPPADDGGTYLVGYRIYRSLSPTSMVLLATVNDTEYLDIQLENGRTYYYWIAAVNALLEGSLTGPVSAIPANVRSQVVGVVGGAGVRQASLSWGSPFDGGSPITGFRIYRATTQDGAFSLLISNVLSPFTDTRLQDSISYWYRVSAMNRVGEGPMSAPVQVTTLTPPAKVTGMVAVPGARTSI